MIRTVILILCSFLLTSDSGSTPQDPSHGVESTDNGIVLTLEFPLPVLKEVKVAEQTFVQISLPGCGYQHSVGKPLLPVLRKLVEIPGEANLTLTTEVLEEEEIRIEHPILPAQPPIAKSQEHQPRFVYDREFYLTSSWIPAETSTIEKTGMMRKHKVALVKACPVSYLPSGGKLSIIRRLKLTIEFDRNETASYSKEVVRYLSPTFEKYLSRAVTNFHSPKAPDSDVGYLIIAPDGLAGELAPLIQWKRSKGFHTTLVTLSDISPSPTAEEIKTCIQDAYDTWAIPPSYVLLVGDTDSLPTWTGEYSYSPTDLYYSTVDGEDIFPDLGIGRFSVETPGQLSSVVEKIIGYEKCGWSHDDERKGKNGDEWLERAYFIASTDPHYHQVAEATHEYCMEIARGNGMTCDSLWGYYGTGTPIDSAFNSGRSMVVYSGHGSVGGWGGPGFDTSDIALLQNVAQYPLVLSHACLTGNYRSNCFGEALTRGLDNGSLAFVGSSSLTYWDRDDIFQRCIFDAFFSDSLHTVGEVIGYGKFGVLTAFDTLDAYYYYEVYNLLGDPSLDIYTDSPHQITVTHPDTLPGGSHILEVEVRDADLPVDHALVSCTGDSIWTAYTDSSGMAQIELETSSGDTVRLTVTGHNLRPYQSCIPTTSQDTAEFPRTSIKFTLLQNHPNPFRDNTQVEYYLSEESKLTLEIYDSAGRVLMRQADRTEHGHHLFKWDGKNSVGESAPSGVYFCRLKTGRKSLTIKMVLVK